MKKEYIYAGISILCWSTSATITKLLLGSINSIQLLFVSSIFAFIFLLTINIINGNIKETKKYTKKDYIQLFFIGITGTFLYELLLCLGINSMYASQAFIINYLWPIMTVIFGCIILKERMTIKKSIAIILSFIGVIIVTSNGDLLRIDNKILEGAIFCILAAISYGLFAVLNKLKNYNELLSMMYFYLFSFLISSIYLTITHEWFIPNIYQLLGLLWNGIFISAVANTTWIQAIKEDTVKISNLAYITPFISLIWTTLILKEKISIYAIIGLVIIISGIFIQLNDKS